MQPEEWVFRQISLEELDDVAVELVKVAEGFNVILFYGEMGAGKTTLIKSMGKAIGVSDAMNSPTFSIINEYNTHTGLPVYHFDFYRIRAEIEASDIGVEEYFYSGNRCLIEWPEKIPSLLPDDYAAISLTVENDTHRTIAISLHGRKEEKRV